MGQAQAPGAWQLERQDYPARQELYRIEAKRLAERYAVIALEEFDLRTVALLEGPDGTENALPPAARRQRHIAGVSELRTWLGLQAAKAGTDIILSSGASTATCQHCGAVNRPADRAVLKWVCDNCHATWDRMPTPLQIYAASQRVPMPAQRLCS